MRISVRRRFRRLSFLLSSAPSSLASADGQAGRRFWLRRLPVLFWLGSAGLPVISAAARPPSLMLAARYRQGMALDDFWVSEKYDGLRAYWDGHQLYTRGGEPIRSPAWFTQGWPAQALDGELWGGRGRFEQTLSTVRQQVPQELAWRAIRFMVFDLPAAGGSFDQRLPQLKAAVDGIGQPWVMAVRQRRVASHQALQAMLDDVEGQGGEGLVLHRGSSLYTGGRSEDLLKFKSQEDAEATVIEHVPGKGKYRGMVGALVVETPQGLRFSIGSGLPDALRRDPPPVGSTVTYRYRGMHASGIPRFAVFLRQRRE